MPEDILNNWRNWDQLAWLENLRDDEDNEMYRAIHLKIVSDINNLWVSDAEKTELFTDYYKNIKTILTGVFDRRALNGNTPLNDDKVEIWLPTFWSHHWNLLILWKFPWEETLKHKDEWLWYLYFLDKTNWFWYLMNYKFNAWNIWEQIINQIKDENYDWLFDLQSSLLEDNHIAIWDMVHLCYSVGGSSSDDKRIPISYSKIWDLLLRRLRFNENMDIDIVIWGHRKKNKYIKSWSMNNVDFLVHDGDYIRLSDSFLNSLWENVGLRYDPILYKDFEADSNNCYLNINLMFNWYNKNIRIFLGYDSSWQWAIGLKLGNRDNDWFDNFFGKLNNLWNNH